MNGISDRQLRWLFVAQGLTIAPLLLQLPLWVALLWASSLCWRHQIQRGRWPYPNMLVKLLLGCVCLAGIVVSFGGMSGLQPLVGFLVCAFALKLIELRRPKDVLIVLFIGFIAVSAQFLFAQHVMAAGFALLACGVLLSAWQACLATRVKPLMVELKAGFWLLVQSLPFMALLFIVMPRIGPLWAVPMPGQGPTTGFSDDLQLGGMAPLAQSRAPAFRVGFQGAPPPRDELYFRGLVLEEFDGSVWRPGPYTLGPAPAVDVAGRETRLDLILEPHQQPWLFTLGLPQDARSRELAIERVGGQLLRASRPVVTRASYQVTARLPGEPWPEVLEPRRQSLLTALPGDTNPRLAAWAASRPPNRIVADVYQAFAADFTYTLAPPHYGSAPLDQFFFNGRRGYCEHFATTLAVALRAAGVPARLVVGYQGGEFNNEANYLLVRQLDAHAWVEAYWPGRGWQRLDPTAAVAPDRVELGAAEALDPVERALVTPAWHNSAAFAAMRQAADAFGYRWNRWVLNYDNSVQLALLKRLLGSADPLRVGAVFVGLVLLLLGALLLWPHLSGARRARHPAERRLGPALRRLQRHGFSRRPGESLAAMLRRVAPAYSSGEALILRLAQLYEMAVYGEDRRALAALGPLARQAARLKRPRPTARPDSANKSGSRESCADTVG